MKKASWILLTALGAAILIISLVSAYHAYTADDDYAIGPLRVSKVAAGDARVASALRGIRGTSAAYGVAFGVLFLATVLGPYRRGDVWAWKALLVAGLAQFVIVLLRIPLLDTQLGTSATLTQTFLLIAGLALDVKRLKTTRE